MKNANRAVDTQKTAAKKIIGDIGLAVEVLGKGDVSGVMNAEGAHTDSLLGDIDLPLETLSNGKLIEAKRSTEEAANSDDLVKLGLLGNGCAYSGNHYGGGLINIKREENVEENGIGPIEAATTCSRHHPPKS